MLGINPQLALFGNQCPRITGKSVKITPVTELTEG